jgi:hypothetical protein
VNLSALRITQGARLPAPLLISLSLWLVA